MRLLCQSPMCCAALVGKEEDVDGSYRRQILPQGKDKPGIRIFRGGNHRLKTKVATGRRGGCSGQRAWRRLSIGRETDGRR